MAPKRRGKSKVRAESPLSESSSSSSDASPDMAESPNASAVSHHGTRDDNHDADELQNYLSNPSTATISKTSTRPPGIFSSMRNPLIRSRVPTDDANPAQGDGSTSPKSPRSQSPPKRSRRLVDKGADNGMEGLDKGKGKARAIAPTLPPPALPPPSLRFAVPPIPYASSSNAIPVIPSSIPPRASASTQPSSTVDPGPVPSSEPAFFTSEQLSAAVSRGVAEALARFDERDRARSALTAHEPSEYFLYITHLCRVFIHNCSHTLCVFNCTTAWPSQSNVVLVSSRHPAFRAPCRPSRSCLDHCVFQTPFHM
jgi:hypothetical protein